MSDPSAPIPVEDLLRHADWVRSVAFQLVRDHAVADDLVQEVWLAALRNPPTSDRNLRGWLRRVLHRLTYRRHRDARTRSRYENATARPEASDGREDVVERAETQQRLGRLVLELPEPYRTSVLLRHFEELPPKRISERLGVPVDTVNSRLQRGHAMLRDRLGTEDGPHWERALLPLLWWPPETPPTGTSASAAARPLIAVGAAAAACIVVLWMLPGGRTGPAAPGAADAPEPAPAVVAIDQHPGARTHTGESTEAPGPGGGVVPAETAPPAAAVRDRLPAEIRLDLPADAAPGAVVVHLAPFVSSLKDVEGAAHDVIAANGAARADLAVRDEQGRRIAEWELRVDHPDWLPAAVRVRMPVPIDETTVLEPVTIRLRRAPLVTGTVDFDGAAPDAVADVGTVLLGRGTPTVFDRVTVSAGAPAFRVRAMPDAKMLLVAARRDRVPDARPVQLGPGAQIDVGVVSLARGVRIAGSVASRAMSIAAGARVMVSAAVPPETWFSFGRDFVGWGDGRAMRCRVDAPVAADGSFSAEGLTAGRFQVECQLPDLVAVDVARSRQVVEAPEEHVSLRVDGGLVVVYVRCAGRPVTGAAVTAAARDESFLTSKTDGDGIVRFLGTAGTAYTVRVHADGFTVRANAGGFLAAEGTAVAPAEGAPAASVEIALAESPPGAVWVVTLRPAEGDPPRVASFGFSPPDFPASPVAQFTRDVTGTDGVFRVEGVPPGRWRVEIRPGCEWAEPTGFLTAPAVERTFAPGPETSETVAVAPAGRLVVTAREADGSIAQDCTCKVRDQAGGEVPLAFCIRRGGSVLLATKGLSPFGPTDAYPALPPGRYTVECILTKTVRKSVTVEVVAGRVAEAVVVFDPR